MVVAAVTANRAAVSLLARALAPPFAGDGDQDELLAQLERDLLRQVTHGG